MVDSLSMREPTDRSPERSLLDPQLQPESPPHFTQDHATHSESHPAYSQMEAEETESHHDTFFDGSEMIHAAFAAQAIELAERERADALQSRVQVDFHNDQGARIDFPEFDFGHCEGMVPQRDSLDIVQEPGSTRPRKRRKTESLSGRKGKAGCRTGAQEGDLSNEIYLQNDTGFPVNFGDARRARIKGHSPADIANRKQNHISAEQKRRTAIKTGYEALYRVIPALRDVDLKEGKGRGGSGPGGGGARAIKPEAKPVADGETRRRASHSPAQSTPPASSTYHHQVPNADVALSRDASPDREGDKLQGGLPPNKDYHHSQQYDEDGKPLRPGVRSIFPLVRQPGSEVIDGRQGPRSESVVLQQTVNYLRQEQTFRLQLLKRLASLRQLAKRTFPEHDHDRLGLCSRLVEAGPSSASTLETTESQHLEGLTVTPGANGTVAQFDDEVEQISLDISKQPLASHSPQIRDPEQLEDGPDVAVAGPHNRSEITTLGPNSQEMSEALEESAYAATFEAALSDDHPHIKRSELVVEDTRDGTPQNANCQATDDVRQQSLLPMGDSIFKVPQNQNRVALVNWENEWDGGAFVEGEDAE